MSATRPLVIAVLDDELHMRRALRRLLTAHGYEVELLESAPALLAAQGGRRFDCILLDLHMPVMDGMTVLRLLAQRRAHPPVIIITGQEQPGSAERTAELGACACLFKPLHEQALLEAITDCTAELPDSSLNQRAIPEPPLPAQQSPTD